MAITKQKAPAAKAPAYKAPTPAAKAPVVKAPAPAYKAPTVKAPAPAPAPKTSTPLTYEQSWYASGGKTTPEQWSAQNATSAPVSTTPAVKAPTSIFSNVGNVFSGLANTAKQAVQQKFTTAAPNVQTPSAPAQKANPIPGYTPPAQKTTTPYGGYQTPAPSQTPSATPQWQQNLESYKTNPQAGQAEIARAGQVYQQKMAAGDAAGANAAHTWANQIRDAMGTSGQYNPQTGAPQTAPITPAIAPVPEQIPEQILPQKPEQQIQYGGYPTSQEYDTAINRVIESGGQFQRPEEAMAYINANPNLFALSPDVLNNYRSNPEAGNTEIARLGELYNRLSAAGNVTGATIVHNRANQIREAMGVAEQFNPQTGAPLTPTGEQLPGSTPATQSQYANDMQNVLDKLQESIEKGFSYDPKTDPAYQTMVQNATLSAMEELNARGILNSSITQDQVAQAISGVIGNLMSQAYGRYQNNLQNMFSMYSAYSGQEQQAYERQRQVTLDQLAKQKTALDQKDADIKNAINEVNAVGYVTNRTSIVLGIPVGTPSFEAKRMIEDNLTRIQIARQNNENEIAKVGMQQAGETARTQLTQTITQTDKSKSAIQEATKAANTYFDGLPADDKLADVATKNPKTGKYEQTIIAKGVGLKTKSALKNQFNTLLDLYLSQSNPYQSLQGDKAKMIKDMPDTGAYLVNALENALSQVGK